MKKANEVISLISEADSLLFIVKLVIYERFMLIVYGHMRLHLLRGCK